MLEAQWAKGNFVCIGLDSEFGKAPRISHDIMRPLGWNYPVGVELQATIAAFNRAIVEATSDLVCAYKVNTAFYEEYGAEGIEALQRTIANAHNIAPDVPVILDAKRADISNTNEKYVQFAFDYLQADAITVNPYLGGEALEPFLTRGEKGIFVVCRTSNPGAEEFQNLFVNDEPLYRFVARRVTNEWNINGNCGLVFGATYPGEIRKIREIAGDMPIFFPGIGAQRGDLEEVVKMGKDSRGRGMIVNSSRDIIYASDGSDFAEAARRKTEKLRDLVNQYR